MKKLGLLLSVLVLVSCAPQPTPDFKATKTAIAHSIFMTITAQAPTVTPTPPGVPKINVTVLGCNTSVDIVHGMGEVTNAYVTVSNVGSAEATNVCITLHARDEGQPHPDKTRCVAYLPPGHEVTEKVTVDTEYKQATDIVVIVTTAEGIKEGAERESCREIDPELLKRIQGWLGIVKLFGLP